MGKAENSSTSIKPKISSVLRRWPQCTRFSKSFSHSNKNQKWEKTPKSIQWLKTSSSPSSFISKNAAPTLTLESKLKQSSTWADCSLSSRSSKKSKWTKPSQNFHHCIPTLRTSKCSSKLCLRLNSILRNWSTIFRISFTLTCCQRSNATCRVKFGSRRQIWSTQSLTGSKNCFHKSKSYKLPWCKPRGKFSFFKKILRIARQPNNFTKSESANSNLKSNKLHLCKAKTRSIKKNWSLTKTLTSWSKTSCTFK